MGITIRGLNEKIRTNPQDTATKLLGDFASAMVGADRITPMSDAEMTELGNKVFNYLAWADEIKNQRKVLDKGFVRLIDYMGSDLSIVRAARVSYNADWRSGQNENSDEKLIKYLINNNHTSPFESVVMTFEIKCPLFIARQWHRHRTWSYNEVSARYTELPEEYYIPLPEHVGTQSKDNKQVRNISIMSLEETQEAQKKIEIIRRQCFEAFTQYKVLINLGTPREIARSVLPANTYTRYFGTVDLHNLFHFLQLRLHSHAQYEIRKYAEALLDIAHQLYPIAVGAWIEKQGWNTDDKDHG